MGNLKKFVRNFYYGQKVNENEEFRHNWVISHLNGIESGKSIIDVGAGECRYKKYCAHLNYKSQDFCEYTGGNDFDYGLQTKKWDTSGIDIVSDITDIPVKDNTFDAILCTEVLEHVPHPELAIKELSRICCMGGLLLLTAPFCSMTHFAPYHFSTGFNRFWYESILSENGFQIKEITANGNYYKYLLQEIDRAIRLNRRDLRFVRHGRAIKKRLQEYSEGESSMEDIMCFGYNVLAIRE